MEQGLPSNSISLIQISDESNFWRLNFEAAAPDKFARFVAEAEEQSAFHKDIGEDENTLTTNSLCFAVQASKECLGFDPLSLQAVDLSRWLMARKLHAGRQRGGRIPSSFLFYKYAVAVQMQEIAFMPYPLSRFFFLFISVFPSVAAAFCVFVGGPSREEHGGTLIPEGLTQLADEV